MVLNFLVAAFLAGAPLILATVGEIFTEKSGNINLGVEGTMYIGAVCSLAAATIAENHGINGIGAVLFAFISAVLSGMLTSAVYSLFVVSLRANQNVIGLTITILGTGIGNFWGERMGQSAGGYISVTEQTKECFDSLSLPCLSSLPIAGKLIFSYNWLVYLTFLAAVTAYFIIFKTKTGRRLIAVGENSAASDAAGISVTRYRYLATITGGGLCGLAGMYMCMVTNAGVWVHDCISGYGWLAVALVIFSAWHPLKAIYCSLIFGALMIMRLYVSVPGLNPFLYDMCPYVVTSIVIIITSARKKQSGLIPEGCGKNYYRETR